MRFDRLTLGQRFAFWLCATLLWILVTGLVPSPELAGLIRLGVPLGLVVGHLWRQASRPKEPVPARQDDVGSQASVPSDFSGSQEGWTEPVRTWLPTNEANGKKP